MAVRSNVNGEPNPVEYWNLRMVSGNNCIYYLLIAFIAVKNKSQLNLVSNNKQLFIK